MQKKVLFLASVVVIYCLSGCAKSEKSLDNSRKSDIEQSELTIEQAVEVLENPYRYEWKIYGEIYSPNSIFGKTISETALFFQESPVLEVLATGMGWKQIERWDKQEAFVKNRKLVIEGEYYMSYTEEDLRYIQKGLKSLEEVASLSTVSKEVASAREALALFYYYKWNHVEDNAKKGLYWAYKAAEYGKASGMKILSHAYAGGNGVEKDIKESVKWLVLAERSSRSSGTGELRFSDDEKAKNAYRIVKAGISAKVNDWAENHPDAFFTPPDTLH